MNEQSHEMDKITRKTGEPTPDWNRPVSFPEWRAVLELEPLDDATRERYVRAIIRTLQDLLGHADVKTTQIYTHVTQKPGLGVRSPLDRG